MALGDIAYRGVMKQTSAFAVVPVTPSGSADLPDGICRGLLLSEDQLLTVIDAGGTQRTLVAFQKGYNWVAVLRVLPEGTITASIWALY